MSVAFVVVVFCVIVSFFVCFEIVCMCSWHCFVFLSLFFFCACFVHVLILCMCPWHCFLGCCLCVLFVWCVCCLCVFCLCCLCAFCFCEFVCARGIIVCVVVCSVVVDVVVICFCLCCFFYSYYVYDLCFFVTL